MLESIETPRSEVLVEIKGEKKYQEMKEVYAERWEACRKWTHKRGINFIVLTDVDIRDARFTNI